MGRARRVKHELGTPKAEGAGDWPVKAPWRCRRPADLEPEVRRTRAAQGAGGRAKKTEAKALSAGSTSGRDAERDEARGDNMTTQTRAAEMTFTLRR